MKVQILDTLYWVGAIDWNIRDFHGYVTPRGTTYNCYLFTGREPLLIDTVKEEFFEELLRNIRDLIDPKDLKHIIVNHIENDHASSLGKIMDIAKDATVYISERGRRGLERFYDLSGWQIRTVKTGDKLKLDNKTFLFIETPMLHWPDSMMTYIEEDGILISQDAFGQHLASSERFDDDYLSSHSPFELEDAIIDYYANILMPFGKLILDKIEELSSFSIRMILPDHGLIWRGNPKMVIEMYKKLAKGWATSSVTIIFDTMWHGTEFMIPSIVDGIKKEGLEVKVIKLRTNPSSFAVKEFFRSRGTLVGTPTLNNSMFPSVAEFLQYLKGLRPKDRIVSAFGCYGWSGGGVRNLLEEFKKMGLEVFEPGLEVNFKPNKADIERCFEFGRNFALKVKEYQNRFKEEDS